MIVSRAGIIFRRSVWKLPAGKRDGGLDSGGGNEDAEKQMDSRR